MRPADVTVLLSEISGVRAQPTVPAIGAANLRIQGLPGRYSELLSDGLPLYGGPVSGLGLLQIPPLDLRQAEVIKGAATALYGPSALGGVVNLVSRAPGNEDEILLNRTSRSGTDRVAWATRQLNDRWGYTLLAGVHRQQPVDVDGDGWADLPSVERAELRPRVYCNGARGRRAFATIGGMVEDRKGGTMAGAVAPNGQHFPEGVKTTRFDGGVVASFPVGERDTVTVRGAATGQWHRHEFGPTVEHHRHSTLFSELAVTLPRGQATWLVGAAFERDGLHASDISGFDYAFTTPSVFAQGTFSLAQHLSASSSGRCDAHSRYGTVCSPRVSILWRPAAAWAARLSAATGSSPRHLSPRRQTRSGSPGSAR
jgi:iron complex outermembrane receptor protein